MADHGALEATKALLSDLIAFPTISSASNLDLIAYLVELLEDAGADVVTFLDETGQKANLFATLGPKVDGGIVLSGHSDVVPVEGQDWVRDPFAMTEEDGSLFGRGACDMKGFVAAAVAMAPYFADQPLRRPLHFAITYDEEIGCFGAQALLQALDVAGIRPGVAIVGEPTEMRIVDGHKGCYEYTTEFWGSEGHSSTPDAGASAIEYAIRFVARLLELRDEIKACVPPGSRFVPAHTTVHIGRISGGTARNIIARHCKVDWEIRPVQRSDADHIKAVMQRFVDTRLRPAITSVHANADIVTRTICEVEGFEPVETSEARDIVTRLTGANSTDVVAFGTEAGLFQAAGISAIICGPGSIAQAHRADEFVTVDQLDSCLKMLSKLQAMLI